MCKIHSRLVELFPKNSIPVNWKKYLANKPSTTASTSSLIPTVNLPSTLVYFPVLNLHDEVIFEVRRTKLHQISKVIRDEMESVGVEMECSVKFPVKLKQGSSWGTLTLME